MERKESSYYAEILILVDGWPWNLSEFDFRRFFAAGSCPRALAPVADEALVRAATRPSRVSENRRVAERRESRRERRKSAGNKKQNKKARRAQLEALARAVRHTKVA